MKNTKLILAVLILFPLLLFAQKKDFIELIELLFGDDFLLDNIEEGIYIKNRELYEKNGQLIAKSMLAGLLSGFGQAMTPSQIPTINTRASMVIWLRVKSIARISV